MADVRFAVAGQSPRLNTYHGFRCATSPSWWIETQSLGGDDQGANPVEYILAGYVGCLNVMAHLIAAEQGIRSPESADRGQRAVEPGTSLWPARRRPRRVPGHRHHFSCGERRRRAGALATWLETIQARCPVHDNLTNLTPAQITLAPVRAAIWN